MASGIIPDEYTKTVWANDAEGGTPINATRLNNIEDGLEQAVEFSRVGSAEQANNTYPGRSIASIFQSEVEEAGGVYKFLSARAKAANYDGLRIRDYVDVTLKNSIVMRYRIGAFDHYYNCADTAMGHHIHMVPDSIYDAEVHWNNTNTNQGTSAEPAPYIVSNLHTWETGTFLPLLPDELQAVLINFRALLETRYNASSQLAASTSWAWKDLGKVFSLSETEVYGQCVWGTPTYSVGFDSQLPIFRETKDRIKGRRDWWLRTASGSSATHACDVDNNGIANNSAATGALLRPLPCFLIG